MHGAGGAVELVDRLLGGPRRAASAPTGRPATMPSDARDGLLPVQQRRDRRPARARRARPGAGADPRLGRAPRQRDQRHLRRRPARPVHLDPPVAAVSRDRPGPRRRLGRGAGYTVNLPVAPGSGDEVFCGWSMVSRCRWRGCSSRSWCWSRPALTRTRPIRWPIAGSPSSGLRRWPPRCARSAQSSRCRSVGFWRGAMRWRAGAVGGGCARGVGLGGSRSWLGRHRPADKRRGLPAAARGARATARSGGPR